MVGGGVSGPFLKILHAEKLRASKKRIALLVIEVIRLVSANDFIHWLKIYVKFGWVFVEKQVDLLLFNHF